MSTFEILSLDNNVLWSDYLQTLPIKKQDIYFTPEFYSIYENYGDGKAQCFVFKDGDSLAFYPFLINEVNSLGFKLDDKYYDIQGAYGYNGVISNDDSPEFIIKIYNAFDNYCNENNIIAEFTRFHPLLFNHNFSKNYLELIKDRETVYIDLTKDYEHISNLSYKKNCRNMLRKSEKDQLKSVIHINPSIQTIKKFYDIYIQAMKAINANKFYCFDLNYFIKTFELLNEYSILIEIIDLYKKNHCTGIFFIYNECAHYHLSARSPESNNAANNLLIDSALKYALSKGCKKFHLGGGTTSDSNDSLLKFKSSFSPLRAEFYIGKKIHNQIVYDEVVRQWMENNPDKVEKYKNMLLKYRY